MNRVLVKIIVTLLAAVQSIHGQGGQTIKDVGFLRPSNCFNPSKALADVFDFLQPAIFDGVLVPDVSVLEYSNPLIVTAIDAVQAQIYAAEREIVDKREQLKSLSLTDESRTLSSFLLDLQRQSVARVSYLVFAIASVISGEQPKATVLNMTTIKPMAVGTVEQQAFAFANYSKLLTEELQKIARKYEKIQNITDDACNCPNATNIKNLIDSWTALNANVSRNVGISVSKWKLSELLSTATSTNLAAAIEKTAVFLGSLTKCTSCIINGTESASALGSRVKEVCVDGFMRTYTNDVVVEHFSVYKEFFFGTQRYSFGKLSVFAENFANFVDKVANDTAPPNFLRIGRNELNIVLKNLKKSISGTFASYKSAVLSKIQQWTDTFSRNQNALVSAINNLSDALTKDSDNCTLCLTVGQGAFKVKVDWLDDLRKCEKVADRGLIDAERNISSQLKLYALKFEKLRKRVYACVTNRRLDCCNSVVLDRQCSNTVSKKINDELTALSTTVDAAIASTLLNLSETSQKYETCLKNANELNVASLKEAKSEFDRCTEILELLPLISNLTDSTSQLAEKFANSTGDPACLDQIQVQLEEIHNKTAETMHNITKIELSELRQFLNESQATVDRLNEELKTCDATTTTATTEAATTTTVDATTTPASDPSSPNACVTWKPYLGDSAPSVDGFSVGAFIDATEAYVGLAHIIGKNTQPGRLRITGTPTIYLSTQAAGYVTDERVFYLSVSSNCTCTWVSRSLTAPGAVLVGLSQSAGAAFGKPLFIARVNVTKNGQMAVTVALGLTTGIYYYSNVDGLDFNTSVDYPILACNLDEGKTADLKELTGFPAMNTLQANQCLFLGHYLTSANGCFTFTLKVDGNAVIRKKGSSSALFETNTSGTGAFQACLAGQPGTFVVSAPTTVVFNTNKTSANRLVLENNGNLILYAGTTLKWQSNSAQTDSTCA